MSATGEQILRQALALPLEERAELIEQLLATFQGPTDPSLDQLWIAEAHDRLDAYDRGEVEAVSVEEVFEEIERDYQ
ncbi:MAG TPA: addiction module protein [Pyrinomonadaceae bacterium]